MKTVFNGYTIPFWISSDYFVNILDNDPQKINCFPQLQKLYPEINRDHSDLHIYPYTDAIPAILSMGCNNQCSFCPTGKAFHGRIYYGDYDLILSNYKNQNVHFLDENFFRNDMKTVLPLLKKYNVTWLAMGHYEDVMNAYEEFGEKYLYECGLRVIEIGLENIALMRKVQGDGIPNSLIEIYYLNLSLLPGENVATIKETANWMKTHSLRNPIHHFNGVWYAPGQYYFPYDNVVKNGIMLKTNLARVVPTYVPYSFLNDTVTISNVELVNKYAFFLATKDHMFYPKHKTFTISDFVEQDYRKIMWTIIGIRVGAII